MTVLRISTPRPSCVFAAVVATLGALAPTQASEAPSASVVTASFWSADRKPTACRQGRVEIIVGGSESEDQCGAGRGSAAGAPALRWTPEVRVEPAAQRVRDDDRRAILLHELEREQSELARLRAAPANVGVADALVRTRANVAALQRELARIH